MIKITIGLTKEEVIKSKAQNGSNEISSVSRNTFFKLLLQSLGDPIIKILLIALAIKIIFLFRSFDWFETIGIVIAIFLSSFISTISEYGSEEAFNKLQEEASKIKTRVKREGKKVEIPIDEVVVGDIVYLASGDKIPADGYLIEGSITVDESSLNGETKEAKKESVASLDTPPDIKNKVFRGSVVYSKEALLYITEVGDKTLYGKIAGELQETSGESPLKTRLAGLAKVISKIGYIGALLVTLSYLFSVIFIDNDFEYTKIMATITDIPLMVSYLLYCATLSVTIIVVAVPEGLPMMITLVLSSNMKKMLKDNVLVRKMVGIETAGSINLLLTDKTGTLTKGKLEVVTLISGDLQRFANCLEISRFPKYYDIVYNSLVYNNASFYSQEGKAIGGNITDRALLEFVSINDKNDVKIIQSVPFDSANKYSAVTIKYNGREMKLIKGASEKILPYCKSYFKIDGEKSNIFDMKKVEREIARATSMGMRVIVLAAEDSTSRTSIGFKSLIFVGIALIKDELRPETVEGLKLVSNAGIQTIMITGDAKATAVAIGRELNMVKSSNDLVLTSDELNNLADEKLKNILPNLRIVARALPTDKSRLVRIAQESNLVVGMTGDGVNDAPALKKCNVGFAMGSGTEVSKEASDIIILDDNFLSISKAILYGRTIFKSLRKFIVFQLTVNMCALVLSILGPILGIGTPITIIQMLWINMIMDTLAGLAFSYEAPLIEYMNELPKAKNDAIINKYMYSQILFTGLYSALLCILFLKLPIFKDLIRPGEDYKYLMTAYFAMFIFIDVFNAFNARTERINLFAHISKNKVFVFIMILIAAVQMVIIYNGGTLFRTYGLTFQELVLIIVLAFTVIPVDMLRKFILKKKGWQKAL